MWPTSLWREGERKAERRCLRRGGGVQVTGGETTDKYCSGKTKKGEKKALAAALT
jgi:hypothetical protein